MGDKDSYPETSETASVKEDKDKCSPKGAEHGDEADHKPHNEGRGDEVPEGLHPKETRKGVTLHRLENVVLSHIKHLRVIPAILLNRTGDVCRDTLRQRDLPLRTGQQESIEDLLSRGPNILAANSSAGRVRLRGGLAGRALVIVIMPAASR